MSFLNEWLKWAKIAFQSSYGFEWQGDSLLIARKNLLYTFIDYYKDKFKEIPNLELQKEIAEIIAWNIFQMDGLKYVIPMSCHIEKVVIKGEATLFGAEEDRIEEKPCEGCKNNNAKKHNGIYVKIMDWKEGKEIKFADILDLKIMKTKLTYLLLFAYFQISLGQNWVLVDSIQLNSQNKITDFETDDFNNLYWIENSSRLNKMDFNTRKNLSFSNHTVLENLNTQNILQITLKSGFFNLLVLDNQLNPTQDLIQFPMELEFNPTLISLADNNYLWGYDPTMQRLVLWNYNQNKIWKQSVILSEKTADEFYSDLIYNHHKIYLIGTQKILIFDDYANLEAVIPFQTYHQIKFQSPYFYFTNEQGFYKLNINSKQIEKIEIKQDFDYFSINHNHLFVLKDKLVYLYKIDKN